MSIPLFVTQKTWLKQPLLIPKRGRDSSGKLSYVPGPTRSIPANPARSGRKQR